MTLKRLTGTIFASFAALVAFSVTALASGKYHGPTPKATEMQPPVNELARRLQDFHYDWLMPVMIIISVIVFILMAYIVLKFRAKASPTPSKTTHNTLLEVIWTGIPILILALIIVPSWKLLYFQDTIPETEFAVRIIGNQWNWTYEYPDHDGVNFTAVMVPDNAFENNPVGGFDPAVKAEYETALADFLGKPAVLNARLLDTDLRMVVPVNTKIKVYLTASDVIHAWTIPAFGVKLDAVPGRQNETWFEAEELGTYYGQCSELCGKDHAYMPIVVEVVSKADFAAWVERAKLEFADTGAQRQFAATSASVAGH